MCGLVKELGADGIEALLQCMKGYKDDVESSQQAAEILFNSLKPPDLVLCVALLLFSYSLQMKTVLVWLVLG